MILPEALSSLQSCHSLTGSWRYKRIVKGSSVSRLFPRQIGGGGCPRPAGRPHSWGSPRPACGVGRLLQKNSAWMQLAGNHALSIKAAGAGSHLAIQEYGRDSSASSTPGKRNRLYSPPELSTKVTARTSGVKGTRERLTPTTTAIRPISLTLERRLSPWYVLDSSTSGPKKLDRTSRSWSLVDDRAR